MILPAMGVVSEILPTFCKKDIFGYKQIALSSLAIALIGYLVWGQFEVIMSQGVVGKVHIWETKTTPNGFGVGP